MDFNSKPKNCQILFLDMNAFFASVEQQIMPVLRNRPVAVTPFTGDSGCIISPSYEAKYYGIKTGMRVGEAKRICPQINIIESRPAIYRIYHKEIVKLAESFSPFLTVASIDEMFIKLSPSEQTSEKAFSLSQEIKHSLCIKVGDWLKCSVGIGPNRFLAKQAAEFRKPDGFFEIKLESLRSYYEQVALRDLCGINYRMEKHFNHFGIYSPVDLYNKNLQFLSTNLGQLGKVWLYRMRGYEVDDLYTQKTSIGHSYVLPPELRNKKGLTLVLEKLVEKTAYRLRKSKYLAENISLQISFLDQTHWNKSLRVQSFDDNKTLNKIVFNLLNQCQISASPLKVAVSLGRLVYTKEKQLSLFSNQPKQGLYNTLDRINDKYGSGSISPASLLNSDGYAPDRISFGLPDYEIFFR